MTNQIVATQLDVLCGRDKVSFNHVGNRRFRQLIASHLHLYNAAPTRKKKTKVVISIVEKIRAGGGRFLKHNKTTNEWYEASEKTCREKVGHALRDKTPTNYAYVPAPPSPQKDMMEEIASPLRAPMSSIQHETPSIPIGSPADHSSSSSEQSLDDLFSDDEEDCSTPVQHVDKIEMDSSNNDNSSTGLKSLLGCGPENDGSLLKALGRIEPDPIRPNAMSSMVMPFMTQQRSSALHQQQQQQQQQQRNQLTWCQQGLSFGFGDSEIEQGLLELDRKYDVNVASDELFQPQQPQHVLSNAEPTTSDNRLRMFLDLASAL